VTVAGNRLRTLVREVIASGPFAEISAELGDGHQPDVVIADTDVDWTDQRAPLVARSSVRTFADDDLWSRLASGTPAWVNVAAYPLDDGRSSIVVTCARDAVPYPADPAISIAAAPPGVLMTTHDESDAGDLLDTDHDDRRGERHG